MLLNILAIRTD